MKKIISTLFLAVIITPLSLFSQGEDALYLRFFDYQIIKHINDQSFSLKNNEGKVLLTDLKFVGDVMQYLQVIDKNNQTFYLNEQLNQLDSVDSFLGMCGTVPHYEMTIIEKGKKFIVMEDETFYDHENKEPAKEINKVSKSEVDSIFFINRQKAFNFTANYGVGSYTPTHPRALLFAKNGKYGFVDSEDKILYDDIQLKGELLELKLNGLIGYYGVTQEAKYKSISAFSHYLASFILPNGKTGWVDVNGNEYFN